jgi:menaquinone-dependent protoporphyrinogen oxidase
MEGETMKVLVAYASRHGATEGIAERIGGELARRGVEATVRAVGDAGPIDGYDAFVVGSAAYMGRWLKDATRFLQMNRDVLEARPLWLFSSGPIGDEKVDKQGRDVLLTSEPVEFRELAPAFRPRGTKVFFGAFDPDAEPVGLAERLGRPFMQMAAVREAMPAGDFRDWPEIESWADEIAAGLAPVGAPA